MLDSTQLEHFHKAVVSQLTLLRQRAGLSQTALAAELGADQSTISRVEAGTRDLGIGEAFAWSEALGLSPPEAAHLFGTAWIKHAARAEGYWRE